MPLSMTPPASRKRRLWPFLLLIALLAVGAFFLLPSAEQGIQLQNVLKQREEAILKAPFAGAVQEVYLKPGDTDLPPGTPAFSYNVVALREELAAAENHADTLAQTLPPAARALAATPDAVSAAMQERNLLAAQAREQAARIGLEAASDSLARLSVQAEALRARAGRGEARQADVDDMLKRRDAARLELGNAQSGFERASLERHKQEEMLRVLVDMERSLASENTALYRRFTAYKAALGAAAGLQAALGHSTVTLERGGRVLGVDIKPGDPVSAGQAVARLDVLPMPLRLSAWGSFPYGSVEKRDVRVVLTDPASGKEMEVPGHIAEIGAEGEGTVVIVTVEADEANYEALFATPDADIRIFIDK